MNVFPRFIHVKALCKNNNLLFQLLTKVTEYLCTSVTLVCARFFFVCARQKIFLCHLNHFAELCSILKRYSSVIIFRQVIQFFHFVLKVKKFLNQTLLH